MKYSMVTALESYLLRIVNENFVGHGLQKSENIFSKLKNNLVGVLYLWTYDVPDDIQHGLYRNILDWQ